MRGKSSVRTNEPGTHSSGPRPKSHSGPPLVTSLPTLTGAPQFRCAVPAGELPVGWQWTASCCEFTVETGVLALLKTTDRSPFGSVIGSEPWSLLQAWGSCVGSNWLPRTHSVGEMPLISSGVDQVLAWSVDMEP